MPFLNIFQLAILVTLTMWFSAPWSVNIDPEDQAHIDRVNSMEKTLRDIRLFDNPRNHTPEKPDNERESQKEKGEWTTQSVLPAAVEDAWDDPDNIILADPDPNRKSGSDPFVFGDWKLEDTGSILCENVGVERGHYDNDRFLECPTYKWSQHSKVLVNYKGSSLYDYRDFVGLSFTHVWQDANQNMSLEPEEVTPLSRECHLLDNERFLRKYHTNGNLIDSIRYCDVVGEPIYQTDIVYMMRGI